MGEIDKEFSYFFSVLLSHLQNTLPADRRKQLLWLTESHLFSPSSNQEVSHRHFAEPCSQSGCSLGYLYISSLLVSSTAFVFLFPFYTELQTPQARQVAPSHIDPTPCG